MFQSTSETFCLEQKSLNTHIDVEVIVVAATPVVVTGTVVVVLTGPEAQNTV